jgi:hypothetical protein
MQSSSIISKGHHYCHQQYHLRSIPITFTFTFSTVKYILAIQVKLGYSKLYEEVFVRSNCDTVITAEVYVVM